MRLDHLLSKEEEVRVGLLLGYRGNDSQEHKEVREAQVQLRTFGPSRAASLLMRLACSKQENKFSVSKEARRALASAMRHFGGDAERGNTRTHPEHEG